MKRIFMTAMAALTIAAVPFAARAEETVGEKVDSSARHATAATKKEGRAVEDKMCAKGDAKCAAQKVKHAGQNGADAVKNTAKDAKNKVD